jgi:uncharacterized protein with HEPN domain
MKHDAQKYFNDILIAIGDIKEFTKTTKTFHQYSNSKVIKSAVERKLAIIGEAIVQIKKIDRKIEIENSLKIIMLRNLLIHAYDSIQDEIIWGIIVKNLNPLKTEVIALLKKEKNG